jgi:hypothetical protein
MQNDNHGLQRTRSNYYNQPPNRGVSRDPQLQIPGIKNKLSTMSLKLPPKIIEVPLQSSLSTNIINEIDNVQSVNSSNIGDSKIPLLEENKKVYSNIFNVNSLIKIKSAIDLKLSKLFNYSKPPISMPDKPPISMSDNLISIDFPLNRNNLLIIPNDIYNNILLSSEELHKYIFNNIWLISDGELLSRLNSIVEDIKLFKHIQLNLNELLEVQNRKKYDATLLLFYRKIDEYFLDYGFNGNELYNDKLNKHIYNEFKAIFGLKLEFKEYININNLTELKFKEFYILNDLNYLKKIYKNKIIGINLIDNFITFNK